MFKIFPLTMLLLLTLSANEFKNPVKESIYIEGERLLPFSLYSQHEKLYEYNTSIHYILVTYDKLSTRAQNHVLAKLGTEYMHKKGIMAIVDVSVIPSAICSVFVLPKMCSYEHPLLLSYDIDFSRMLPYKENTISVMKITKDKIEKIWYIDDEEALRRLLE